ncbi:hypothetical protein D3C87_2103630 [compost metagenome]
MAHPCTYLVAFYHGGRSGIDPSGRAMIDKEGTFTVFAIAVAISANNDIAVPITVHIPCIGY